MKKNTIIAVSVSVILLIWMISGIFSSKEEEPAAHYEDLGSSIFTVRAIDSEAQEIDQEIILSGKTEPARRVTLRSELDAKITTLGAKRGDFVEKGELIATLDEKDLPYLLQEAQALLEQRKLNYKAAQDLFEKKFQSETRVAETKAELEHARSITERIRISLGNTTITAPFSGMLQSRKVEIGDYVKAGDEIAQIVEINPIVVTAQASERQIHLLIPGSTATAKLTSNETLEGVIRYVASESDQKSRTFSVEMEASNPNNWASAGETAQLIINTKPISVHKVSPASLSLNDAGDLGVKYVDDDNIVHFAPAQIAKSTTEAIWLSGLPKHIRLITVGQYFVQEGEHVAVDLEATISSSSE